MFSRPLLFVGVLVAAVVVPYVLLDDNLSKTAQSQWSRLTGKSGAASKQGEAGGFAWPWQSGEPQPAAQPAATPISTPVSVSLEEALRFDITPPWVTARWPRVSTVVGDANHMGLRVALVTGTQASDVAGSLTYYFDERHELTRITLSGMTGDESRLVAFAAQRYGLKPAPTLEAGLYITGDAAKPTSTLRVSHLPLVQATAQYARAQVSLDLKRSDAAQKATVTEERPKILSRDFRRW